MRRLVQHVDATSNLVHFSYTPDGNATCMCDCRDCSGTYKECLCKECTCRITNIHDPEGYTPQDLRAVPYTRSCKDCGGEIFRKYKRGRWPIRCAECR